MENAVADSISSADWNSLSNAAPFPTGPVALRQREWDKPIVENLFNYLFQKQSDEGSKARLLAVAAPHSGDWLNALPLSSCGLRLDDEAVRISVGLRLGTDLCNPHQCVCGSLVQSRGIHGLSCKKNGAQINRHFALNDIIH